MNNVVKTMLSEGNGLALGTFVLEFVTDGVGRIAATAGAQFIVFDMEHSGANIRDVRAAMSSTRLGTAVPFMRPAGHLRQNISGALDAGARGLIVPLVETAEDAASIASYALYPPVGTRGAAFGVAHDDFSKQSPAQIAIEANESIAVIAQIETVRGLENVESIAATPGIDGLWLGQYDLTLTQGIPGQFDHPLFTDACIAVLEAGRRNNIAVGLMASTLEQARHFVDLGYNMVAYLNDIELYRNHLKDGISTLRGNQ